ncbi:sugar porter family MFS transporter [Falsirhodobacter sp. 20TX0035]|uniref:sugar porter family MFS transporter n=1 Tax=Falsirhodobacter sp. 20TX0035 TaxID=3022019 RepID=UPI00232E3CF5|nr:sugar porter family MFS transporter [Falsirhodobacter sp. 20TX0035]MDB6453055.1 sugar porter family MFS transporter [Falsirhodobacter sp. 20TX0035]
MQNQDHDGALSGRLFLVTGTAALGGFLFGYDSSIINGAVDAVRDRFGLSAAGIGFTVSCALLGAMVGAWYAGVCADKLGRVRTMLIAAALLAVSAIGSAFAFSAWDLILWRFVGGIGVGFASVIAPAYIAEVSPSDARGRLGSLQQMAIVFGIFLSLLVSALFARAAGGASELLWGIPAWRWMFLSAIVPTAAYGLMALRLPESPRFLVERNRTSEAATVLQNVVGVAPAHIPRMIQEIRATVTADARKSFSDLKGGTFLFLPVVWVGIILSVFQQFVGINVIFYYSTTLWQSVGFDESNSFMISVFMSFVNILATFLAIALIDKVGRRALLLAGSATMTVTLAVMALAFHNATVVDGTLTLPDPWGMIALVAANLFILGFAASWGPVVWVLLGEMFPNRIRGMALGIAAAAQWLANFAISTTFPILSGIGLDFAYSLYAFFALLSLIFVWRAIEETKGRSLEQIRDRH